MKHKQQQKEQTNDRQKERKKDMERTDDRQK